MLRCLSIYCSSTLASSLPEVVVHTLMRAVGLVRCLAICQDLGIEGGEGERQDKTGAFGAFGPGQEILEQEIPAGTSVPRTFLSPRGGRSEDVLKQA